MTGNEKTGDKTVIEQSRIPEDREFVTKPVRIAAAWAWRLILIVLAAIPIIWLLAKGSIVVIPLLVAILLTALITPIANYFRDRLRWPAWIAILIALLALIAGLSALIALVVVAFRSGQQFDVDSIQRRGEELLKLLEDSPLHITTDHLQQWYGEATNWVKENAASLVQGTLAASSTAASVVTGATVALFAIVFYLADGRRIWLFIVSFLPASARAAVDGAGERAWISTGHYVRVQVVVAFIDAIGIFLGALILQVPYALAIGIIVFIAAFVPLVGAVASGAVAVLIALIANGFWNAVIMLAIVIAVMAIEANVLQPLIMGQAVELHPLAVLVSVSAGSIFAGIAGAVFAVPVVAAIRTMVKYIQSGKWRGDPDPTVGLSDDSDSLGGRVPNRQPLSLRVRKKPSA